MANKGPSVSVSVITKQAQKELSDLNDALKHTTREFETQNIALQAEGKELDALQNRLKQYAAAGEIQRSITARCQDTLSQLTSEQTSYDAALKKAQAAEAEAIKKYGKSAEATKKLSEETKTLEKKYNDAKKAVQSWSNKVANSEKAEAQLRLSVKQTNDALVQQASKLGQVGNKSDSVAGQMKNAFNMLRAVALGYAGKTLFSALIGSNAEFEQYMTSFEVMLGSADKAKAMMSDLEAFAAKTPLQMTDTTKAAQLLLNYGVAQDQVIEKMTQLGNLSLGQADKLDRISLAYGQMLAKGKVTGEELRQMTEAGVPLTQALADAMGVTTAELSKLIERGQVGIPELDKAIEDLTTGTGKFAGMLEEQSQTMAGMWSTLKDQAAIFAREVGDESFGYLKGELQELMDELERMSRDGSLSELAGDIGENVANAVRFIANLIKWLWDMRKALLATGAAVVSFKAGMAIGTVLQKAVSWIRIFNTAMKAGQTATMAMKTANDALNISLAASPWGLVAGLALAFVGTITTLAMTTDNATSKIKEMVDSFQQLKESVDDNVTSQKAELDQIKQEYQELEKLSNASGKTSEQKALMLEYINRINSVLPGAITIIDQETMAYQLQRGAISDLVAAKEDLINLEADEKLAIEARAQNKKLQNEIDKQTQRLEEAQEGLGTGEDRFIWDEIKYKPEIYDAEQEIEKAKKQMEENQFYLDSYHDSLEEYIKKHGTITKSEASDTPYTPPSGTSSSSTGGETMAQQWLRELRYVHDKGLVSDKEYMEELILARDNCYKEGTAEWQSLDLEAHRIRMKLLEEEAKARENGIKDAVQSSLDTEKDWYDRLIDKVNDYYDTIERREERQRRHETMAKLKAEKEKYQNAVTALGKDKLNEAKEKIDELNRQDAKLLRTEEKARKLKELDSQWDKYESSQQAMLKNVGEYAKTTAETIEQVNRRLRALAAQTRDYLLSIAKGNAVNQTYNQQQSFQQNNTFEVYDHASKSIMDSYVLDMPNRFPGRR